MKQLINQVFLQLSFASVVMPSCCCCAARKPCIPWLCITVFCSICSYRQELFADNNTSLVMALNLGPDTEAAILCNCIMVRCSAWTTSGMLPKSLHNTPHTSLYCHDCDQRCDVKCNACRQRHLMRRLWCKGLPCWASSCCPDLLTRCAALRCAVLCCPGLCCACAT